MTPVGAPGTVAGVTATEVAEAALVPNAFAAVAVNVYAVPLVKAVTVHVRVPVVVQVLPSGVDVTVYPVITEPPLETGAVHDTTTCAFPAAPVTLVGTPGAPVGVAAEEGVEATLGPDEFAAITVKV